jgi:DNA (cytosine-5)-methyltransferase 1
VNRRGGKGTGKQVLKVKQTGWLPGDGPTGTAIELCSGLGGIGLGLRSLGFLVAHAYDSWDEAVAVYNHNAPDPVAVKCNLLTNKGLRRVKDDCRMLGDVDLLAAGPPCKGFSQIRNGHHHKAQANQHNRLLTTIPDYVAALRPRFVLIENVPDVIRHRGGKTLKELLGRLKAPGPSRLRYRVEYDVFDAAQYGTPQARRRLFVFCVRLGAGEEALPDPGPDLTRLYTAIRHGGQIPREMEAYRSILADPEDPTMTAVRHALSDIPVLGPGEPEKPRSYAKAPDTAFQRLMRQGASTRLSNTQTPAVRPETSLRLRQIPPGGCARDIPPHLLNGLSRRFDSAYRRLHPDAPSTALSTKYDCVYHYTEERSLSVREYARIQGLPDFVVFPEAIECRRSAYEMIGNTVPPLLVNAVLGEALGIRVD